MGRLLEKTVDRKTRRESNQPKFRKETVVGRKKLEQPPFLIHQIWGTCLSSAEKKFPFNEDVAEVIEVIWFAQQSEVVFLKGLGGLHVRSSKCIQ